MSQTYDVAVIGAGVFGAWTALTLRCRGLRVLLMDGYGSDEIYTRWAAYSLPRWKSLAAQTGEPLFHRTGVLWLAEEGDPYEPAAMKAIASLGAFVEKLSISEIGRRFPQFALDGVDWGFLEPEAGVLMACRAVDAAVRQALSEDVEYRADAALPPKGNGRSNGLQTQSGASIIAGTYVFACGPWLPKIFPALLASRFFISRQEVFFFGVPAGDSRFAAPLFPTWLHRAEGMYGMPDLENRGVKIACDTHGPAMDPDTADRTPSLEGRQKAAKYLARRFPAMRSAPVVESRVCQYENTSSGDFLVDRHPEMENVWLVGGGSGHGFKHGPAIAEYVATQIFGEQAPEPRFLLASKAAIQRRAVF